VPRAIDSRNAGTAAATKRLKRSTTVTHVAATGIFTLPAGSFLDELQPNDVVVLSALTGGTGFVAGDAYYLCGPAWTARGTTTFRLSALPDGPPIVAGSNITAGTASSGLLTLADDGVLSSNYVSPLSPAGR
jgi:hypothetical protein